MNTNTETTTTLTSADHLSGIKFAAMIATKGNLKSAQEYRDNLNGLLAEGCHEVETVWAASIVNQIVTARELSEVK